MSPAEQQIPGRPEVDEALIYVVDDEAMIGDVVQIILRMEGYRSKYFQDPEEAWRAFRDGETKPALLLADYVMLPINGMQLIDRCKQLHPTLKTILYSGNAGEHILHKYPLKPDAFLRKPFLPRTLLGLIRSILGLAVV
jgi:DNA-binding NtrC family response regulator